MGKVRAVGTPCGATRPGLSAHFGKALDHHPVFRRDVADRQKDDACGAPRHRQVAEKGLDRGPDSKGPVDLCPVRLAEAARRRPRGYPFALSVGKSGRGCLGGRGNAPARGRQARPDLSRDKSGGVANHSVRLMSRMSVSDTCRSGFTPPFGSTCAVDDRQSRGEPRPTACLCVHCFLALACSE